MEHLKRVMSTHSQFAWNVECALHVVAVLERVQAAVPEVELDPIGYQLEAHLTLRCTGSVEHDRSSSKVQ